VTVCGVEYSSPVAYHVHPQPRSRRTGRACSSRFDEEVVVRMWVEEPTRAWCGSPEKYLGKFVIDAPGSNQDAGA
jgi:hypothetical protein